MQQGRAIDPLKAPYVYADDSVSWKPINQSSFFVGNLYYRFRLNKKPLNSGNGPGVELGLNFGYLFNQKLLIAPYVGYGRRDIFWYTRYSNSYLADFDANFDGSNLHGNDSTIIYRTRQLMAEGRYFHDRQSYYGIMIRLPYTWAPVVKIYRGEYSSAIKTIESTVQLQPIVSSDKLYDNDYYDISRDLNIGVEVMLLSGYSKKSPYAADNYFIPKSKRKDFLSHLGCISIYFEQLNFKSTHYSFSDGYHNVDVPMSNFMSKEFMNKHKFEYNLGLKMSFGFY